MTAKRLVLLAGVSVLAVAAWRAGPSAWADAGAPTPLPPPGGKPPPLRPMLGASMGVPYDFHFAHLQLYGQFFQPNESVRITPEHVALAPITVTADQNGQFSVYVDFTWVFCGPGASVAPAPAFHASGNEGSAATFTLDESPCPRLVASQPLPPPSGGSSGQVGYGTAVPVGTVVAATVMPAPGTAGPPPTPRAWPTPAPILTTNTLEGFGFHPGEQVKIAEINSPAGPPPAVSAGADSQGRIRATIRVYVPGQCEAVPKRPELRAAGDRGTSASTMPAYPPVPEYPCPAPVPAATGLPGPDPAGTHLGVTLHPRITRSGGMERAEIRSDQTGRASLVVRYPGHGQTKRLVAIGSSGRVQVRFRIPRTAVPGTAHVRITFEPGNQIWHTTFTIAK